MKTQIENGAKVATNHTLQTT